VAKNAKLLHKLLLIVIKYIPITIALFYILNTALNKFDIDAPVISNISGVSLLTWLFLYLSSLVFQFCIYHRLFLYFILVTDFINIYDYYFNIPLEDEQIIEVHSIIIGILIFLLLYIHLKGYDKCNRGGVTKDS
jgi:hypothetical protein